MGGMVASMLLAYMITRMFPDVVVARLPFEPIGLVTSMSQRGLSTEDSRACGMFFIYMSAVTALRGVVSKLMGSQEGPRQPID